MSHRSGGFRITYTGVVASVALLLAVGTGGAVAVTKITGHEIENGSLSGRDVRNGTLTLRDLGSLPANDVRVRRGPEGYLDCADGCAGVHQVTAQPVSCRGREVPVGGGISLPAQAGAGAITESRPLHDARQVATGWTGSGWVEVEGDGPVSIPSPQAWVLCAEPRR